MRRLLRIALLTCLGVVALLVSYCRHRDQTFLARTLELDDLPRSMQVVDTHEVAWTDYSRDWIVRIDPLEADQILQGRAFEPQEIEEPVAVFGSETGAYDVLKLANTDAASRPLFVVGDAYCAGNWSSEDRVCIWRSTAHDQAPINRSGD